MYCNLFRGGCQELSEQSFLSPWAEFHLREAELVEVVSECKPEPNPRGEVSDAMPHDMNRHEAISIRGEVDVSDCVA